jgi:hypothetical protein
VKNSKRSFLNETKSVFENPRKSLKIC